MYIQSNKYNEHSMHTLEVDKHCMQVKSRVVFKCYIINIIQAD